MKVLFFTAMALLQFAVTGAAAACHMAQPEGQVILTVEGQIRNCNSGLEARFDFAMLEALPKTVVKTENPWDAGMNIYEGVLLRDLADAVEANGTVLRFTALNDYRADIPVADTLSAGVILAYRRNGSQMPVSEKGPLFVVFPFSGDPSLSDETRYAQSVWQVTRITVK
jgi:hypothetical protein